MASLVKRWLLGTRQGSIDPAHLPPYLNEFVFRFNRASGRLPGGLLFYRILELAVAQDPVRHRELMVASEPKTTRASDPGWCGRRRMPVEFDWHLNNYRCIVRDRSSAIKRL